LTKKNVIFNDPIYGFISTPNKDVRKLIEHPYFQRLRRIKQLGLTHLVYPGAYHTRFQHAMGAMHLMGLAIEVLRGKDIKISDEEAKGVYIAILLHDIGHGPFSHTLESSIVHGVTHEDLSEMFMDRLNVEFDGKLDMAIQIFKNKHKKKFLHQLVSSQLDMDRLDYLKRDSFFSGVLDGVVSSDRIIKMLNVKNGMLVVDVKGIYSVEKFLISRSLMYWQVYLHKTVIAAEFLLIKILKRAKYLAQKKEDVFGTPALLYFLRQKVNRVKFEEENETLERFSKIDDYDIFSAIKVWTEHTDLILSDLCQKMVNRKLFKVEIKDRPFSKVRIEQIKAKVIAKLGIERKDVSYFVFTESIRNSAYDPKEDKINILYKDGSLLDIAKASDQMNVSVLSRTIKKHVLCFPKDCN
jgi:hypothetical protein